MIDNLVDLKLICVVCFGFMGIFMCIYYIYLLFHDDNDDKKKLYKKSFHKNTSSEIMKKYGISETEYLLLKEELEQRRLFNYNDDGK